MKPKRIAIVGAGISGLSAAQRLGELDASSELTIFEASDRVGGVIQSTEQDGFLFEHSADSFIVSPELPWAGELCEKLGVPLIETTKQHRGALILRGNAFHPIPEGLQLLSVHQLGPLLRSPLLSWPGKLRVACERFVSQKTDGIEESLEQFTVRRYGREMFERIVQPLVGGIYTADPKKLSMSAALPQFVKLEEKYGSLARASANSTASRQDRGARYSLFRSPKNGMQGLINTLRSRLVHSGVSLRTSTQVQSIKRKESGWELKLTDGSEEFDAVICALSIPAMSKLASDVSIDLSRDVSEIECVSTAIVCLGYDRSQVAHPLNTFGCVIPSVERRRILAVSFTNVKFPVRAPEGSVLMRVFVGGALQPELAELDDAEMLSLVHQELHELFGVQGDAVTSKIVRWPRGTPQYHLGHVQRVKRIEAEVARLPNFEIAGNAFHGVGVPQCVRGGWAAADRLHEVG